MQNEFKETRILFYNTIPFNPEEPMSYDQWMELSDDYKCAALYLVFYDQITLAWEKAKSLYTPTSDGVSILLQYLNKNVKLIEDDPKRYSPGYIYKIAFNALYCECHDRMSTSRAFNNEVSEQSLLKNPEGDYISFFDTFSADCLTIESQISEERKNQLKETFWGILTTIGIEDYCIIQKMIGTDSDVILDDIKNIDGYEEYVAEYMRQNPNKKFKLPRMTEARKSNAISKLKTIFDSHSEFYNISSSSVY